MNFITLYVFPYVPIASIFVGLGLTAWFLLDSLPVMPVALKPGLDGEGLRMRIRMREAAIRRLQRTRRREFFRRFFNS